MEYLIVIGVIALIAVAVIAVYNGLVAGRVEVRNAWAQIDVQLKRRHDLIPNLVNAVKGAMEQERGTLSAVMEARGRALGAKTPGEAMQAENALTSALRGLVAVVESYPQLRSQENVKSLMEELETTENQLAFARQHYNDAVAAQNMRMTAFPGVLLARSLGFAPETLLELPASERAALEAAPEVHI